MTFLKIIEQKSLIEFIFKTRASEVRLYLEDILKSNFNKIEKDLYNLDFKKLVRLNELITQLKEQYFNFLNSAPVPFTFFITDSPEKQPETSILRAGKIYFKPALKRQIEESLKGIKLFYRIQSWKNLLELVFPATVDPKIEFFYKDVFWTGKHKFCIFCNTTWHDFNDCPILAESEPRKIFTKTLELSFSDLAKTIWKGICKEKQAFDKLKYFYVRHFYLLPEFLKIVFFKEDVTTWSRLELNTTAPVRGGNLGIGLEALIKKDLNMAEKRFMEVEGDFRAGIGLFFVSLFKKDIIKSFYYLETVLSKELNAFVKSYLLFWKGYLKEVQGDEITALELYKDAFETDRTCLPAFYRLNLVKYKREEINIKGILSYFNHPYLLYWAYLEPLFIKEQTHIEKFLEKKLAEKKEIASQRLKEAEDLYYKLKELMSEKEQKEYEEKLKDISDKIYSGGIGIIEKAADRAMDLTLEFRGYIYNKLKTIQRDFEEVEREYKLLLSFWQKYPFKQEDASFGRNLKVLSELVNRVSSYLKKQDVTKFLSQMISDVKTCKTKIKELKELKEDLNKKWIFRRRLADFLRTFTILETFLVFVYISSFFLNLKGLGSFFNFPMFLVFSIILLIVCLVVSYLKHYE